MKDYNKLIEAIKTVKDEMVRDQKYDAAADMHDYLAKKYREEKESKFTGVKLSFNRENLLEIITARPIKEFITFEVKVFDKRVDPSKITLDIIKD
jgi:hypothetical protein